MSRSGVDLCDDIRRSILLINDYMEDYTTGKALPVMYDFDFKTQDAVIYRLMIIGEAAGDLLDDHRKTVDSLSTEDYDIAVYLKAFRRMRDKLIHQHWTVDPMIVQDTVVNDLPPLKHHIERLRLILALKDE
jgi:uncharacterized protein with HEPN domain